MESCTDLPDVGGWSARRLVTSLKEHLSVPLQFSGPQGFSYHEEGPAVLCCPWGYQLCLPQQEGCTVRMGGAVTCLQGLVCPSALGPGTGQATV